jgi:hypothetical protein
MGYNATLTLSGAARLGGEKVGSVCLVYRNVKITKQRRTVGRGTAKAR